MTRRKSGIRTFRYWRQRWYWFVASLFVCSMTYVFLEQHNFFVPSHNPEFRLACIHLKGKPFTIQSIEALNGFCPEYDQVTARPRRCSVDHLDAFHSANLDLKQKLAIPVDVAQPSDGPPMVTGMSFQVFPIPARSGNDIWKCNIQVHNGYIEKAEYVFD